MAQRSNREALIKGAMKCLQTKGFARTSARDIAAASGANLASIGYHFGSKEALLNEALIRMFKRRNWKVGEGALAPDAGSPLDRLTKLFVDAGDVFKAPRPVFVAFVEAMAQADRSPELRKQMAASYRAMRKDVAETFRTILGPSKRRLNREADVMAVFFLALFDGLVLQWLLEPKDVVVGDELIGSLVTTLRLVLRDGRSEKTSRSTRTTRRSGPRSARNSSD
jgi:AcrR family transcriptional regulator